MNNQQAVVTRNKRAGEAPAGDAAGDGQQEQGPLAPIGKKRRLPTQQAAPDGPAPDGPEQGAPPLPSDPADQGPVQLPQAALGDTPVAHNDAAAPASTTAPAVRRAWQRRRAKAAAPAPTPAGGPLLPTPFSMAAPQHVHNQFLPAQEAANNLQDDTALVGKVATAGPTQDLGTQGTAGGLSFHALPPLQSNNSALPMGPAGHVPHQSMTAQSQGQQIQAQQVGTVQQGGIGASAAPGPASLPIPDQEAITPVTRAIHHNGVAPLPNGLVSHAQIQNAGIPLVPALQANGQSQPPNNQPPHPQQPRQRSAADTKVSKLARNVLDREIENVDNDLRTVNDIWRALQAAEDRARVPRTIDADRRRMPGSETVRAEASPVTTEEAKTWLSLLLRQAGIPDYQPSAADIKEAQQLRMRHKHIKALIKQRRTALQGRQDLSEELIGKHGVREPSADDEVDTRPSHKGQTSRGRVEARGGGRLSPDNALSPDPLGAQQGGAQRGKQRPDMRRPGGVAGHESGFGALGGGNNNPCPLHILNMIASGQGSLHKAGHHADNQVATPALPPILERPMPFTRPTNQGSRDDAEHQADNQGFPAPLLPNPLQNFPPDLADTADLFDPSTTRGNDLHDGDQLATMFSGLMSPSKLQRKPLAAAAGGSVPSSAPRPDTAGLLDQVFRQPFTGPGADTSRDGDLVTDPAAVTAHTARDKKAVKPTPATTNAPGVLPIPAPAPRITVPIVDVRSQGAAGLTDSRVRSDHTERSKNDNSGHTFRAESGRVTVGAVVSAAQAAAMCLTTHMGGGGGAAQLGGAGAGATAHTSGGGGVPQAHTGPAHGAPKTHTQGNGAGGQTHVQAPTPRTRGASAAGNMGAGSEGGHMHAGSGSGGGARTRGAAEGAAGMGMGAGAATAGHRNTQGGGGAAHRRSGAGETHGHMEGLGTAGHTGGQQGGGASGHAGVGGAMGQATQPAANNGASVHTGYEDLMDMEDMMDIEGEDAPQEGEDAPEAGQDVPGAQTGCGGGAATVHRTPQPAAAQAPAARSAAHGLRNQQRPVFMHPDDYCVKVRWLLAGMEQTEYYRRIVRAGTPTYAYMGYRDNKSTIVCSALEEIQFEYDIPKGMQLTEDLVPEKGAAFLKFTTAPGWTFSPALIARIREIYGENDPVVQRLINQDPNNPLPLVIKIQFMIPRDPKDNRRSQDLSGCFKDEVKLYSQ